MRRVETLFAEPAMLKLHAPKDMFAAIAPCAQAVEVVNEVEAVVVA